ncbi:MAG: SH3 domain-containing protein [Saprospiraceae bacterium]|nr:SH3 domain-containing protein [Saprospiraceae bacterium]
MSFWRIFTVLFLLAACKNTNPEVESVTDAAVSQEQDVVMMTSMVDYLRVRKDAVRDAEVVSSLREGEAVLWTGKTSVIQDTVTLRGRQVIAPWYEVETFSGITGWTFAGALTPWTFGKGLPYPECAQAFNQGDFSHFYPCLDGISQTLSGPESVQSSQSGLRLRLQNGKSVQLVNDLQPGKAYRSYQFLGELELVYVVKKNARDGSSFLLVHQVTGEQLEVPGIAQVIPLSLSLFCLGPKSTSPGDYSLSIVSAEPSLLREVFQQDFPEQSLVQVRWGKDGLPVITLRDNRGDLSSWKLIRGVNQLWDLERNT